MYRRMENMDSLTERKKNVQDSTLYPCYIRRRPAQDAPTALLRSGARHHTNFSEYTHRKAYGIRQSGQGVRPTSAPLPNHETKNMRYKAPGAPRSGAFSLDEQQIYEQYYSALMGAIVAERLYQEGPLKKLFRQFLLSEAADMQDIAQKVVDDLKQELDVK
eukprot:CAMPEP_0196591788 /NCGR_PEP_ID=MMETSP1081-20130531/70874_1 /TAXON_ID=36882 /ORGANISM="Pyramimonas amylifera, Strain CCMP720" /LENGTH=160 /DNA_ID=CAMNT_0041915273 /DNA_START=165 /DNA_END=644 /DNA_ORIENTATION=-